MSPERRVALIADESRVGDANLTYFSTGWLALWCARMSDELDVDAMLARFRDRAQAVQDRPLPPVAGPQREQFIAQAQLDFQDFAILGDATWEFADGVLTLRIDLGG